MESQTQRLKIYDLHLRSGSSCVDVRKSKPEEKFYKILFEPTCRQARKQDLKCCREWQFAVSVIYLELRKEHKEDFMVGKNKAGIEIKDN